ncbi:MAG: MetS family NSS transporter small subunit [Cyclobacteriaceae bacterium]|nr:MetS family NSS transporter small subunit [Cyclobacteriaceae bacterium]
MSASALINMIVILTIVVGGFLFFAWKASEKEKEKKTE